MSDVTWSMGDDGVGVITLNRPEARNALTHGMYAELERLTRGAQDAGVRCLVITGADPSFCSGDDVRQVMGGGEAGKAPVMETANRTPRLTPAADALLHTDVPVIAAVNGAAVGWGMELSMMADIRVASEKAKFGELFVLRGLGQRHRRAGPAQPARRPRACRRAAVHRRRDRRRDRATRSVWSAGWCRTTS